MSDTYYQALGQNVFVREIKTEQKVSGFVMPDSLDVDYMYGEVVTCSDGYFDQGNFVPLNIIPGDHVAFPKISATKVTLNGEKVYRVFASDLVAKEVKGRLLKEGEE